MNRENALTIIYFQMKELHRLTVEHEYFTSTIDRTFYLSDFRKYQWRLYGMVDMAVDFDLLTPDEARILRRHIRNIAKNYRKSLD